MLNIKAMMGLHSVGYREPMEPDDRTPLRQPLLQIRSRSSGCQYRISDLIFYGAMMSMALLAGGM